MRIKGQVVLAQAPRRFTGSGVDQGGTLRRGSSALPGAKVVEMSSGTHVQMVPFETGLQCCDLTLTTLVLERVVPVTPFRVKGRATGVSDGCNGTCCRVALKCQLCLWLA